MVRTHTHKVIKINSLQNVVCTSESCENSCFIPPISEAPKSVIHFSLMIFSWMKSKFNEVQMKFCLYKISKCQTINLKNEVYLVD